MMYLCLVLNQVLFDKFQLLLQIEDDLCSLAMHLQLVKWIARFFFSRYITFARTSCCWND